MSSSNTALVRTEGTVRKRCIPKKAYRSFIPSQLFQQRLPPRHFPESLLPLVATFPWLKYLLTNEMELFTKSIAVWCSPQFFCSLAYCEYEGIDSI